MRYVIRLAFHTRRDPLDEAAVLDTAIERARKLSKQHPHATIVVIDAQDRTTQSTRMFLVNGAGHWAKLCVNCRGKGKLDGYTCVSCDGLGASKDFKQPI